MQYIKGLDAFDGRNQTAVTLGKFDGLHRGHQKLLNRIIKYAQKEDCDSVVCAFDMDRDCLMTNEERRAFLEDKVDYLIEIPFTREMMEMEAEKFIDEILHKKLHASYIVVGTDFNFGHEKRGNHQMLEKYAAKYGYTVDVVEKAYYKDREISSTYIRELLLDGNVPLANKLLGYPYEITSVVEHGQQLGRTLGFPTMNLAPQEKKILPKYGVYACRVLVDGVWYGGVGNAGVKPTVAQEKRRLFEVYVYGYEGDAYGKTATVQILEFERPETKFHSVEELKDRVMKDMRYGEEYLKNHPQVEKVNHPSLPEHPDHELYQKYFPDGGASIFTFEIKGGQEEAHRFIDHLKIFSLLANVADVKSLVIHPATTTHSQLSQEELRDQGILPNTIRLSVGTEHIDDIIGDLELGFAAVRKR